MNNTNPPSRPSVIVRNPNSLKTPPHPRLNYELDINNLKRPLSVPHINGCVDNATYRYIFLNHLLGIKEIDILREWRDFNFTSPKLNTDLIDINLILIIETLDAILYDLLIYKNNTSLIPKLYALACRDNVLISLCALTIEGNTAEIELTISDPKILSRELALSGYGVHLTYQAICYIKNHFPKVEKVKSYTVTEPSSQIKLDLGFKESGSSNNLPSTSNEVKSNEVSDKAHLYYLG